MTKRVFPLSLILIGLLALCRGEAPAQERTAQADTRLSKLITLSETRVFLDDLLKEASRQSGVSMVADPEKKSWKVRELPVSVQIRDVSVERFQQQIAKLLDLRWVRTLQAGQYTYMLWEDQNARDREAHALTAKEEERIRKLAEGWSKSAEKVARAADMSPEELARAGEADPFLKFATQDPMGKPYVQLVAGLMPAATASIVAGEDFRVPFTRLSAAQQSNVRQFSAALGNVMGRMPNAPAPPASVNWGEVTVNVRSIPGGAQHRDLDAMGLTGMLQVTGGGLERVAFPIFDPSSPMARVTAEGVTRVNAGESPTAVMQELGQKMQEVLQTAHDKPDPSTSAATYTDPKLQQLVEVKPGDSVDVGAILEPLVDKGINVYAEAWKQQPGVTAVQDKGTVEQVLSRVCGRFSCTWEYGGSSVRIKADNWAAKRAAMVSRADLQYWSERAKEKGLTLDDLAVMAEKYTSEQIMGMMASDPNIARSAWPLVAGERKKAILFYAALDSGDAAMARTEIGLPALRVSPGAREALGGVLQAQGISPEDFYVTGARLQIRQTDAQTQLVLLFPPDRTVEITLTRALPAPPPVGQTRPAVPATK